MKIEFISDVVCPWCAIGLHALERAIERIGAELSVELQFRAFELNPQMAAEGEDLTEYLGRKYGLAPQQLEHNQATLRARAAAVGFEMGIRTRIWNSFDAHRLIHWAGLEGRQRQLKHGLLRACHGRNENISSREVLLRVAREAALDGQQADEVLESGRYGDEVRRCEHRWERLGIHAVPSLLIDGEYLIQGGHPPETFEQALRQLGGAAG
ncbi:MAG: DsbA family oxidoreductase [Rhodocyclaceae bacterium]|nr:DsbA family oxidoreductase [Rhodocyclaceae bacterium]